MCEFTPHPCAMRGSPHRVPPRASAGHHLRRDGPRWGAPRASPHPRAAPGGAITAPGGRLVRPSRSPNLATKFELLTNPGIPWHVRTTNPPRPPVRSPRMSASSVSGTPGDQAPFTIQISRISARKSPLPAAAARGTSDSTRVRRAPGARTPGITAAAPAAGGAHPGHHLTLGRPQVGLSQ